MATIVIGPNASSAYPLSSDDVFGIPSSLAPQVNFSGLSQIVLTGVTNVNDDGTTTVTTSTSGYLDVVTNWQNGASTVNTTTTFPIVNFLSVTDFSGPAGELSGFEVAEITQIVTDGITFTPEINSHTYDPGSFFLYADVIGHGGGFGTPALRTFLPELPADLLAGSDTITNLSHTSATLLGYGGNDHLVAGDHGDVLDGGTGSDVMDGGAGNDTFYVDRPTDVVNEATGGGFDTVVSTATWRATAGSEIEHLVAAGTGNIALTGNGHSMAIDGNSGVNTLDDGGAADQLSGGANSDVYIVHNANSTVVEKPNEGFDTIKTDLAFYRLPANVEVLKYIGNSDFHGVGKDHVEIDGGAGNDILEAGAFSRLVGGAGNDTYVIDSSSATIVEGAGGGNDTVKVSADHYVAPQNVENVAYTGTGQFFGYGNSTGVSILGSSAGGELHGGNGNDTLDGNGGNTVMFGNGGADTFVINPYDTSVDRIVDFHPGEDHIEFKPDAGYMGFNQLHNFPTPSDFPRFNADFLEYNQTTGDMLLFTTADMSFTKVAHFDNHPVLTTNDFILIA